MLPKTSNRKGVPTELEHLSRFLSSHNLLNPLLVPHFRLHVIFPNPGKITLKTLSNLLVWHDKRESRKLCSPYLYSQALSLFLSKHRVSCGHSVLPWRTHRRIPAQHPWLPEPSLNSCPCFLTPVSWFLVLADTPAKFPSLVDRDKATLRKPIYSQCAGMTGLLARQSALLLTGKAATWPSPHLPDGPTPSTAPLGSGTKMDTPLERGTLCWANKQAHRPKLKQREETPFTFH